MILAPTQTLTDSAHDPCPADEARVYIPTANGLPPSFSPLWKDFYLNFCQRKITYIERMWCSHLCLYEFTHFEGTAWWILETYNMDVDVHLPPQFFTSVSTFWSLWPDNVMCGNTLIPWCPQVIKNENLYFSSPRSTFCRFGGQVNCFSNHFLNSPLNFGTISFLQKGTVF